MRPAPLMSNKKMKVKKNADGFSVLEVVVAVGIISLALFSLGKANDMALRLTRESSNKTSAVFLMEEAAEGVKFLRDKSWSQRVSILSPGADYHLSYNGGDYSAEPGAGALIDGLFDRRVNIYDVYRDASDNISDSGTLDPGTKKVAVSVSWAEGNRVLKEELIFYVTDLFQN